MGRSGYQKRGISSGWPYLLVLVPYRNPCHVLRMLKPSLASLGWWWARCTNTLWLISQLLKPKAHQTESGCQYNSSRCLSNLNFRKKSSYCPKSVIRIYCTTLSNLLWGWYNTEQCKTQVYWLNFNALIITAHILFLWRYRCMHLITCEYSNTFKDHNTQYSCLLSLLQEWFWRLKSACTIRMQYYIPLLEHDLFPIIISNAANIMRVAECPSWVSVLHGWVCNLRVSPNKCGWVGRSDYMHNHTVIWLPYTFPYTFEYRLIPNCTLRLSSGGP